MVEGGGKKNTTKDEPKIGAVFMSSTEGEKKQGKGRYWRAFFGI